jgi:hypothetical protein
MTFAARAAAPSSSDNNSKQTSKFNGLRRGHNRSPHVLCSNRDTFDIRAPKIRAAKFGSREIRPMKHDARECCAVKIGAPQIAFAKITPATLTDAHLPVVELRIAHIAVLHQDARPPALDRSHSH